MRRPPSSIHGAGRPLAATERRSRFDIYRTEQIHLTSTLFGGGDWHWRLTGQSGAVLADCGGYRNHAECLAAVAGLQAEAQAASVRDPAEASHGRPAL